MIRYPNGTAVLVRSKGKLRVGIVKYNQKASNIGPDGGNPKLYGIWFISRYMFDQGPFFWFAEDDLEEITNEFELVMYGIKEKS